MAGEFNKELKAKIDLVQEYIDWLWEWDGGRTSLILKWIKYKDRLTQKIGKINPKLKQEIDDVQLYIDYLWEQGRDSEVPAYQKIKDRLCKKIKDCQ